MIEPGTLWTLFGGSFLAATLLPGGSEALLLYTLYETQNPPLLLWTAATLGNTLGGLSSWGIGWWLARRFPWRRLEEARQQRALERIRRHGSPALLLSWVPVVGDPLCLAAGWTGIRLLPALLFMGAGKGLRYAFLVYLT
jgi:membrane protein YqaA with SNARE-associated domain